MDSESSMASFKIMNQDFLRFDSFDDTNFTRWQDKMKFLLTTLKVFYILTAQPLAEPTVKDTDEQKMERKKREEDDLICRGHIPNPLSNRLYDLYNETKTAKEIWDALEIKYKAEQHVQVQELQVIVNKIRSLKMDIPEAFQVGVIIAKLPPSWNGFRKKLLHDSKDFSLEEIQMQLRVEEELRLHDKKVVVNDHSKVNLVTESGSNNNTNNALN
ncbi:uncharacterized protein LOC113277394 [Papaver somniferum]|uniref:uncharacterized protein LOC113277394 n=1 Tax=Papaver somniferum TaxID=3469 RepID=UPI000E6FAA21|nr:uncharacterized protein LOC113277394 [Papaver somniferum]